MRRNPCGPLLAGALIVLAEGLATAPSGAAPADSTTDAIGREALWPLTLRSADATLTVFQPQLDRWDGYTLDCRVAVQVTVGAAPPRMSYGVVALRARTLTDKGTRVVTFDQATVVDARFPAASAAETERWANVLATELAGKSRTIALDHLEAQLSVAQSADEAHRAPLRNEPPRILFSNSAAVLVHVDGAPVYRALPDAPFERVVNTRPLLLRDARGMHYLKVFDGWMLAPALDARWTVVKTAPDGLDRALEDAVASRSFDPLTGQTTADEPRRTLSKTVPAIVVATSPTELIVTDGAPLYVPIKRTQLLYAANTTATVFKNADNETYVLIAGRWFHASSEQGPWRYVPANALPADFAKIPDDSPKENVKASVAGTAQAREAAIAASIPQTAAVRISGTKLSTPQLDGEPNLQPIEGTELEQVVNSATPIVRAASDAWYALENGVWFASKSAQGPWVVATSVPPALYAIPPSSPLYYVTFVRISGAEGDTVFEGYAPGYQGTYVDPETNVAVYGTGYEYHSWTGTSWYGAPLTYGFGAALAYTPWTGWAVSFGNGWAWGGATLALGWGWGSYPWWGPWGWGFAWGPAFPWYPRWGAVGSRNAAGAWAPGGWAGYSGNLYQSWGNRAAAWRGTRGLDAWTGNAWASKAAVSYNSRTGAASAGQHGAVQNLYTGDFAAVTRGSAVAPQPRDPASGEWTKVVVSREAARTPDDLYAGADGDVYRRTEYGWERRTAEGWEPAGGGATAAFAAHDVSGAPVLVSVPGTEALERDREHRSMGDQRSAQLRESSIGMHQAFGGRVTGP